MEEKNCENQELEIDLIELCRELKNHITLIIAATVIFAAAAGAYIHFMTVPKYAYTRMIMLPENAAFRIWDQQRYSYVNILRLDINDSTLWKEGGKGHLVNVDLVQEKNIKTNLIMLKFEGTDPVVLKKVSDDYVGVAVQKLNVMLKELKEANFNDQYLNTQIIDELKGIRSALSQSSLSSDSVLQALTDLEKRLNALEKNESFSAKAVDNANAAATKISRNSLIKKSAALGFVLSIMFIVGRYCWRKATETGII